MRPGLFFLFANIFPLHFAPLSGFKTGQAICEMFLKPLNKLACRVSPCQQSLFQLDEKERTRVDSLLSTRNPLLGDSFKPRPSLDRTRRRHIDFRTEGSLLTLAISKIGCARCLKLFDQSD